jgi:thioredoxin reductase (NADPH)
MATEYDLKSIAFPILDETQIAELLERTDAVLTSFSDGQTIYGCGERELNFLLVSQGAVEILDHSSGEPQRVAMHTKGEFIGDVALLTGAPSIMSAVARGESKVYVIPREQLRQLLNASPSLSDVILQAFIARRQLVRESPDFTGLRVIGSRYCPDTFRIRDFLAKNGVMFTWLDVETDTSMDFLLKQFAVTENEMPIIACGHKTLMRNPSNRQIAESLGLRPSLSKTVYDLVVVGAGPAGLAAAVYGASEGLKTVVLERVAPGGQAGNSMRIENYLGFPTGITGRELAYRATIQAAKFGGHLSIPSGVTELNFENTYHRIVLEGGESITSKCLLIASGAEYRKLGAEGCEQFEGAGVYYAATPNEANACKGEQVMVVGGGNSAGQAAVFMAGHARKVMLVIRGDDLYKSMSSYLVRRIEQTPNIEVLTKTAITRMHGEGYLSCVVMHNLLTGIEEMVDVVALFSFIGAVPRTDWLPPEIETDAKGFVRTGAELQHSPYWTARRQPFLLETSRAGVFAAGDVRSDSVKRVASAVGEGAMAVQFVHEYFKTM